MLIFALSFNAKVQLTIDPLTFHSYSIIYLVFTPAFLGFLLTTFTRFSQMPPIIKSEYLKIFYPILVASLLFFLASLFFIDFIYVAKFLILFSQIYTLFIFFNIYKNSPLPDKYDQKWIMIAWGFGISADLSSLFFTQLSNQIAIYLYLILLSFTIAQRMVPFFSHVLIDKNRKVLPFVSVLFGLKVMINYFGFGFGSIFSLIAGVLIVKEFIRWRLSWRKDEPIIWILHLAIYWLPIALIFGSITDIAQNIFDKDLLALDIHILVLGFLTTIFVGFGTRVTLGHSGSAMIIDNYTKVLFYMTQIVLYFRILYSFIGSNILYNTTIFLWIALFIAWGFRYLPLLVRGRV